MPEYRGNNPMEYPTYNAGQIVPALDHIASEWNHILTAFSEKGLNLKPFRGSWTAAQLADHVILYNEAAAALLRQKGQASAGNTPGKLPELAALLLDSASRSKAEAALLPGRQLYAQVRLTDSVQRSFAVIGELALQHDLSECVRHESWGWMTRLELLHLVLFHSMRHRRQLQHIYGITEQRQYQFLSFLFHTPRYF